MAPHILLGLLHRSLEYASLESPQDLAKRAVIAPTSAEEIRRRKLTTPTTTVNYGNGTKNPTTINNQIFLGLFATIGCLMVIASIYFFFIARNGGFYWQKGWVEDYKSTVLRRKGPNGTTLSNATKSTKLGGGSVVPKWARTEYTASTESTVDAKDMRQMENGQAGHYNKYRNTSRRDPELAAYKHEKVAKVGGLNTSLHGTSQWDATNTDRSDVTPAPAAASKKDKQKAAKDEKERKRREKEAEKQAAKAAAARAKEEKKSRKDRKNEPTRPERAHRTYPSAAYSFQQGDDATSVFTSTNTATTATDAYTNPSIRQVSYYESYRPASQLTPVREQPTPVSSHHSGHSGGHRESSHHRSSRESMNNPRSARQSPSHSRQSSPRKQHRSSRPSSDHASYSHAGSSDTGTKVYTHHIPGLSKGEVGFDDSVSQVAHNPRPSRSNNNNNGGGGGGASSSGYRRGGRRRGDSLSDSEM